MSHTILLHFPSPCCPRGKVALGSRSLETWQGHTTILNLQVSPWRWELCSHHLTLMAFWSFPDLIPPHPSCYRGVEWTASPPLWIWATFDNKDHIWKAMKQDQLLLSCRRLTPCKTPHPRRTDRKGPCNCFCRLYLVQSSVVLVFVRHE